MHMNENILTNLKRSDDHVFNNFKWKEQHFVLQRDCRSVDYGGHFSPVTESVKIRKKK